MKQNTSSPRRRRHWPLALLTALLALGIVLFCVKAAGMLQRQNTASIAQAVRQSAAQCYAVEGAYPENLTYLEQHYGLVLNHRKYIVSYSAFSSNLMPEIQVLVRGSNAGTKGGDAP